jgi:hypothetical protein
MRVRTILALGFGYLAHGLITYPAVWLGLLLAGAILLAAGGIDAWLG